MNFFRSTFVREDIKQMLFEATRNSKSSLVISLLNNNNINPNDAGLIDEYNQNLLHIAVKCKNYNLVKHLLSKQIDKNKRNLFGETPFDIAIKNHDIKMMEILLGNENLKIDNDYLKSLNNGLTMKLDEMDKNNLKLLQTNTELTQKNSLLKIKLDEDTLNRKRHRDDIDSYICENKRLKIENDKLKNDNEIMKETIKIMREDLKKKN